MWRLIRETVVIPLLFKFFSLLRNNVPGLMAA